MAAWTNDELDAIGAAEELTFASLRSDGTLRAPVIMWVVRVGDALYVRSVLGRDSSWFRGALTLHRAHIRAGGVEKEVDLVETDEAGDELDDAYRTKYDPLDPVNVPPILAPTARAAALTLVPR
jgi:hypothetical protein